MTPPRPWSRSKPKAARSFNPLASTLPKSPPDSAIPPATSSASINNPPAVEDEPLTTVARGSTRACDGARVPNPVLQRRLLHRVDLRSSVVNLPAMTAYATPVARKHPKLKKRQVQLIANGDLRLSANQKCWPEQEKMER